MNARPFLVACVSALALAAFTGCALGLSYIPTESHAWLSVLAMDNAWGGAFVRGLHRAAAEAAIISAALAAAVSLASTEHQAMRTRLGLGLLALLLIVALVVTGNPLRNDNAARFALSVEVNVVGTLPWLGGIARRTLIGSGPDQTLMARLFTRHAVVLPALLLLTLAAALFAKPSAGQRAIARASTPAPPSPLTNALFDRVAMLCCVLAVSASALLRGASLGAPADLDSAFPARPAWYFQPLYLARQLLPAEHAPALTLLMLALVAGAAPLLLWRMGEASSSVARRIRGRLGLGALALYGTLALFGAAKDARDPEVRWSARQEEWARLRVQALSQAGASLKLGAKHTLSVDPLHRARTLFSEHCSNCHSLADLGPRDSVLRAPSLDGFGTRAWLLSMLEAPDAPHRFGNTPFAGQMRSLTRPPADPALRAAFRPMAADEQRAVADFLSSQAFPSELTNASSSGLELGERIVRERCTSCHLYAGKTDDDESRAPELLAWASPSWTVAHILNPGSGRTYRPGPRVRGEMPGFGGVLSHDEVSLLVDLIRGTLPKEAPPSGYQARGAAAAQSDEGG